MITAGQRKAAAGGRAKSIRHKANIKPPSRTKLGITAVKVQIRQDQMHSSAEKDTFFSSTESTINKYLMKWPHPAAAFVLAGSNKRLCKPD